MQGLSLKFYKSLNLANKKGQLPTLPSSETVSSSKLPCAITCKKTDVAANLRKESSINDVTLFGQFKKTTRNSIIMLVIIKALSSSVK